MSEQNILNPTAASQLNPTYSIPHKDPQIMASWQPRSGKPFDRYMLARGMEFQLHWDKIQYSTYESLLQWFHQYERSFFSYFNFQRNRYFSGKFLAEPQFEEVGNNQFNISATFVEVPTVPMFQYPSTWGVTSIFLEERDDYGQDLVKLTGTWDRRDQNYCLWSESLDNAVWSKATGVTVTRDVALDPFSIGITADRVSYDGSGSAGSFRVFQTFSVLGSTVPHAGIVMTGGIWLKTESGTVTVRISNNLGGAFTVCNLTTAWQLFFVPGTADGVSSMQLLIYSNAADNAAFTIDVWGGMYVFGNTVTSGMYVKTTTAPALLPAPNANANYHGGFAYWNVGTNAADAAEWAYIGYGFRLWAFKGPDMGIMQITLDGVVLGTVDLYAAAATASAAVFTQQSVSLGSHRVKLNPTNTKNAASSAFTVVADAIEVMR